MQLTCKDNDNLIIHLTEYELIKTINPIFKHTVIWDNIEFERQHSTQRAAISSFSCWPTSQNFSMRQKKGSRARPSLSSERNAQVESFRKPLNWHWEVLLQCCLDGEAEWKAVWPHCLSYFLKLMANLYILANYKKYFATSSTPFCHMQRKICPPMPVQTQPGLFPGGLQNASARQVRHGSFQVHHRSLPSGQMTHSLSTPWMDNRYIYIKHSAVIVPPKFFFRNGDSYYFKHCWGNHGYINLRKVSEGSQACLQEKR